jgi:hypothetical protein
MTRAWRAFEKLSLLVWGVMLALYVVGHIAIPVVPHLEDKPQQPGACYNFVSKIGTPLFRCSETGLDGPIEALLTAGWLWVAPAFLFIASQLEPTFALIAAAWVLSTFGLLSYLVRLLTGRRKPRP